MYLVSIATCFFLKHQILQSVLPHFHLRYHTRIISYNHSSTFSPYHQLVRNLNFSVHLDKCWDNVSTNSDQSFSRYIPFIIPSQGMLYKKCNHKTVKNGVFWDVTPCGSCKNRRFGGTWRLLHQGDKNR
jgi:hypothetical protein